MTERQIRMRQPQLRQDNEEEPRNVEARRGHEEERKKQKEADEKL